MAKLKFESDIFKSSNKSIFYNSFYRFFYKPFFIYIKISKNVSVDYYQENKERLQKRVLENLSKK